MLGAMVRRVAMGLVFALPFMTVSVALARSSEVEPLPAQGDMDCQVCHAEFYEAWEEGAHGRASVDPTFREAWEAQGRPATCLGCHTTGYDPTTGIWKGEGILCEACHSPINDNHPLEPMPSDRSAQLCGICHTETHFEWQVSKHRQVDLACVSCHDSHATSLRAESSSALCANCHRDRASNFAHTAHAQQGLTCADCHLGPTEHELGEGHAERDHSFDVRLATCNQCHAYQMHDPVQVHPEPAGAATPPEMLASAEETVILGEPTPASPIGYAAVAGLVGMASGMILSPWLEKWYRRLRQDEDEEVNS